MEDRKLVKFLIPTFLLGFFIFGVPSASAYGTETHAYLTDEIINFYNQSYPDRKIPDELKSYLIDGSRKEDETPRWLNHFYDPIYDRGLDTAYGIKGYRSKTWVQDASKQNEVRFKVHHFTASLLTATEQRKISEISADADFTWNRAIEFYVQGDREKAMFALGHALHLIEDLGVPDHTRNDDHVGGSPYEEFAKRFNLNSPDANLSTRIAGKGPISLNNLDAYFNSLATYSNNNFYSADTIGIQSGYNLPQPDYTKKDGRYFYGFKTDEEGRDYRLFVRRSQGLLDTVVSNQGNIVLVVNDSGGDLALYDYWNHLSPQVIQHGAGVVDLFFQEAEKAKNDPEFAKKEKKNFLTQAIDAAKTAFNQVFNKVDKQPAVVIDVNKQNQQGQQGNLSPTVSVDKTMVAQGETLVEGGQGFSPDSDVLIYFDLPGGLTVTASIRIDSSGAFQKNYVMPSNAPSGQYIYYAKDSKTGVLSNKINYTVKSAAVAKAKVETQEAKKTPAVEPKKEKKEEVTQKKTVKQSVQECSFNTNQSPSHNEIVINEVAWMGGASAAGLGASDEWIELKNLTTKPVNISGWQVVDQDEDIQAVFKEGARIPAGGFYLLERTNDNSVPGVTADVIYTGALANSNEGLRLFASDCSLIDEVLAKPSWLAGDNSSRRTMQRNGDLTWSTFGDGASGGILGTPKRENGIVWVSLQSQGSQSSGGGSSGGSSGGGSNSGGGSSGSSSQANAPAQADVFITEVQITGGTGKTNYDFVEIFNHGSSSVNLNGHRLVKRTKTGTSDTTIKSWTADTIIPAQGYYLWANSSYTEITATPDVTTSGTISNDNGVAIRFGAEDTGAMIDSVGWGEAANAFVEGSVFATNPGANESIQRKTGSGFIDTDNNANDFELKNCLTPKAPPCALANQLPSASFSFSPSSPTTADIVGFDAASSSDPDGQITSYNWDFGDSALASSSNATTTHVYSSAGSYQVSLTVFDNQNSSSTTSTTITVASPAPVLGVLFEQPDYSSSFLWAGTLSDKALLNPVSGSARQLHLKVKPNAVATNVYSFISLVGISDNNDFTNFTIPPDGIATSYADQSYYCFSLAQANTWVDVVLTFPVNYSGIFTSGHTYRPFLAALSNSPNPPDITSPYSACINTASTGQGNHNQVEIKTDGSDNLYHQIGNNLF